MPTPPPSRNSNPHFRYNNSVLKNGNKWMPQYNAARANCANFNSNAFDTAIKQRQHNKGRRQLPRNQQNSANNIAQNNQRIIKQNTTELLGMPKSWENSVKQTPNAGRRNSLDTVVNGIGMMNAQTGILRDNSHRGLNGAIASSSFSSYSKSKPNGKKVQFAFNERSDNGNPRYQRFASSSYLQAPDPKDLPSPPEHWSSQQDTEYRLKKREQRQNQEYQNQQQQQQQLWSTQEKYSDDSSVGSLFEYHEILAKATNFNKSLHTPLINPGLIQQTISGNTKLLLHART